jgi:predicted secreted protein
MKTFKVSVFLGICSLIASCEKESITPEQVHVPLGQEFNIELESNWTTGYHWEWVNAGEVSVLDSMGITYQSKDSLLGAPGIETWMFKSILKGEETLNFEYRSSQGTDTLASASKEFLINVY